MPNFSASFENILKAKPELEGLLEAELDSKQKIFS